MSTTLFEELDAFAKEEYNDNDVRIFKECEICGTSFEAKRANRKYCNKCQNNTKLARERMKTSIGQSKYRVGEYDIPKTKQCFYCNKEYMTRSNRPYCSETCKQEYLIKSNTCVICKQLLYPEIKTVGNAAHPACSELARRENNRYRKCEYCGKEYCIQTENQRFCSQTCAYEGRGTKLIDYICCMCNEVFSSKRIRRFDKYPEQAVCSDVCKQKYDEKEKQRIEALNQSLRNQQIKKMEQTKVEQAKRKEEKLKQDIECYGLCGFCKTSYKDCDLMSSDFRVKPKGAKYNENGKIVTCPMFRK